MIYLKGIMTYRRFEDLPVWQEAIRLAELCDVFLEAVGDRLRRGKQDQLDRCSLSVSNNIAEGFERGTTKELLAFLYIARGSAGETRSMMHLLARATSLSPWADQIDAIAMSAESCGRQLHSWAESLQNSTIAGQRHQTAPTHAAAPKRRAPLNLRSEI